MVDVEQNDISMKEVQVCQKKYLKNNHHKKKQYDTMDYRGQQLCEYIYTILVILFGSIAWVYGYLKEDFSFTFYGWAVGLVLSLLVKVVFVLLFDIFLIFSLYSCVFLIGLFITDTKLSGWTIRQTLRKFRTPAKLKVPIRGQKSSYLLKFLCLMMV